MGPEDVMDVKSLHVAAEQGDASAQTDLGLLYYKGQDVPQDYTEAMRWFRKAADQEHARAQWGLGHMYEQGNGVARDLSEAAKWYRKAAERGDTVAQWNLGAMYEWRDGVPRDYKLAHMWYNLASSTYPASRAGEPNNAIRMRESIASKLAPEDLAEALRLADAWKPTP